MSFLRLLFAGVCCLATAGAAYADEWRFKSVAGEETVFSQGEWTVGQTSVAIPANAIVQTGADGHALIAGDAERLDLSPATKIKLEGDSPDDITIRTFAGALGVSVSTQPTAHFAVMTTHAAMVATDATFGVSIDSFGTTVSVRRGRVRITDLTMHSTTELTDGQTMRILLGQPGLLLPATERDTTTTAAANAAARVAANSDLQPAQTGAGAADAGKGGDLDPHGVGAIKAGAGDQGKAADEAADKLHQMRAKAKLGPADPKAVAAVRRIEGELFQDIDVEAAPWDDDFKWTEVEDGEVRLKPIHRVVLGLTGAESYEFWTLAILACIMLGALTSAVLKEAGFGIVLNAVLVMLAFAVAILVRDAFFRAPPYIAVEPFLSIAMMTGAMPLLLLAGAFAKLRLD